MKISDLQETKRADLEDLARNIARTGASGLRKQDLIYQILEAQAEAAAGKDEARRGPRGRKVNGNGASDKPRERSRRESDESRKPAQQAAQSRALRVNTSRDNTSHDKEHAAVARQCRPSVGIH